MSSWKYSPAVVAMLLVGLVVSGCALLRGSEYPASDITFLVPFAPGGATDAVSRKITAETEPIIKRKFMVVNKPGASGTLSTAEVIQSKPDGYTIGLTGLSILTMQPQISKLPYAGPEDYQPIINLVELPNALVVRTDAPWKTLQELVDDAKNRPGQIRIATTGKLTTGDMLIEEFRQHTKADLTNVPFTTGAGEATSSLLGGHVEGLITEPGPLLSHVQAGKLRLLAFMHGDRLPSMKDVPAAQEIGFKASVPPASYSIIAPKGVDKAIVDKLYKSFNEGANGPGFKRFVDENAMRLSVKNPEQLTEQLKEAWPLFTKILKEMGIEGKK